MLACFVEAEHPDEPEHARGRIRQTPARRTPEEERHGFGRHDDEEHVAGTDAPLFMFDDHRPRARDTFDRSVRRRARLDGQGRRNRADGEQRQRGGPDERRPTRKRDQP
jgi:hypothetical protein